MIFHDDFFKGLSNFKDTKPRGKVPASTTTDELQEIISQAIWEWGSEKGYIGSEAKKLEKDVLQSMFVAFCMGGKRLDVGSSKAKSWLTPPSKEYLVKTKTSNGSLKLSKTQFTEGILKELNIVVPWANVDSLWRRLLEEYPAKASLKKPKQNHDNEQTPHTKGKYESKRPHSANDASPGIQQLFRSRSFKTKTWTNTTESFPLDNDTNENRSTESKSQKDNSTDLFGSASIDLKDRDLLFGTKWKDRLKKAEQERIEKNKRYQRLNKTTQTARQTTSNKGDAFSTVELRKSKSSHITFNQFATAFSTHAKHRDNITRRLKIGPNGHQLHGPEHVITKEEAELAAALKQKAKLNETAAGDQEWMAESFSLLMDAFDRDSLLLHEAFFAFDVAGDGAVSLGEFVGVLSRMKPKLPVTKKQMFAMFATLDVKCARKVKLLEFVSFFLTLYDKKLRNLCEDLSDIEMEMTNLDNEIELNSNIVTKNNINDFEQSPNERSEIHTKDENLEDALKEREELIETKNKINASMKYTSTVVASAVDLLNIELAPPNEQYHGTFAAGISHYIPGTGKGSISSEYFFREEAARIGARHRARNKIRDSKLAKVSAIADEVNESYNAEVIIDTEQEQREEKGRRTRRIHEMLAKRIFQKNQILPIKKQVLGSTYQKSEDPMQWAVEAGKHQLKIEIIDRQENPDEEKNKMDKLKDNIQQNMEKNTRYGSPPKNEATTSPTLYEGDNTKMKAIKKKQETVTETDLMSLDGKVLLKALQPNDPKLLLRRDSVLTPNNRRSTVLNGAMARNRFSPTEFDDDDDESTHDFSFEDASMNSLMDKRVVSQEALDDTLGKIPHKHIHSKVKKPKKDDEYDILNTPKGLIPGRYAHLVRKVGLGDAAVQREMLSLDIKHEITTTRPMSSGRRQWRHEQRFNNTAPNLDNDLD